MRTRRFLLTVAAGLAVILFQTGRNSPPPGAQTTEALSGQVTSTEEGPLEGVLVSAKRAGSTVTITVVSDQRGGYRFPRAKLEPGQYTLRIRAVGYELDGPRTAPVTQENSATTDLKLRKTHDLAAQLTNAEWIASVPGTDQQKSVLLNCMGCHSLERIVRSQHDAAGFLPVLQRMAGYANQSTPLHPQRRVAERPEGNPESVRKQAEYFSTINLSSAPAWRFPLKTLPRPTGRATRVIMTEYDLPRPTIEPHDVIVDSEGTAWFSNFGEQYLGRLDPQTAKVTEYPLPNLKQGWPTGMLDLEPDTHGNLWLALMYQGGVAKFDRKTEKFTLYPTPTPNSRPRRGMMDSQERLWFGEYGANRIGMFDTRTERFQEWEAPTPWFAPYDVALDRNGEAWTGSMVTDRVLRLDPKTGRWTAYLLPRSTTIRRVFVDKSTTPVTVSVGNEHGV